MAITINPVLADTLIIDETAGDDANTNDNSTATLPTDLSDAIASISNFSDAGDMPAGGQVALAEDYVTVTADSGSIVTNLSFASDISGTDFSTTTGVDSGLTTVEGDPIYLFLLDANNDDIVVGRVGDSSTGDVAFILYLEEANDHLSANLWMVQYAAFFNPDPTDDNDPISGIDNLFVSADGSATVNFSQLADAPPGHNKWYILDSDAEGTEKILVTARDNGVIAEVNVSTQGLGVASQDVRFGRELQIDLIEGGAQSAGKNFGSDGGPAYTAHLEDVTTAGFTISQSTPTNSKADILVKAYDQDDNLTGSNFDTSPDTQVPITDVTFSVGGVEKTAAELGITYTILLDGSLKLEDVPEGVTIDFSTATADTTDDDTFDRFTIANIDTEKDYFDVKEVHFGGTAPDADVVEVGSGVTMLDDGPTVSATDATGGELAVDDDTLNVNATHDFSGLFTGSSDFGSDDAGTTNATYALGIGTGDSGIFDCATDEEVILRLDDDGKVYGELTDGTDVFIISVDQDGVVTLDQVRAIRHLVDDGTGNLVPTDDALGLADPSLVTLTATIFDQDGDDSESATANIGGALAFNDSQPTLSQPDDVAINFTTGATGSAVFTADFNNDEPGTVTIDPNYTITSDNGYTPTINGNTIEFRDGNGTLIYHIDVTDSNYSVEVDNAPPGGTVETPLDFGALKSGSPKETLSVDTTTGNTTIVFNGVLFKDADTDGSSLSALQADLRDLTSGKDKALDDLNPDAIGFGVKNGQASQFNNNDGFFFHNADNTTPFDNDTTDAELQDLTFEIQGIGGVDSVRVEYWIIDEGQIVEYVDSGGTLINALPGGQGTVDYTVARTGSQTFDAAYVKVSYLNDDGSVIDTAQGNIDTIGVRLINFATAEVSPTPNDPEQSTFQITATDCDEDTATTQTITVDLLSA